MEIYGMTGERLGTIGQPEKEATMPDWQKALSSKPSISVRKGIAWNFEPPYEDTSTLVLTAPSGSFVDIRLPEPMRSPNLLVDPAFWAFSGIATTTFDAQSASTIAMPCSAHCKWTHEIDSKGPGINDEGDMFLLQNGDCVEVGKMVNPKTGQLELYKEYWTSPPQGLGGGILRKNPCIVAKTTVESTSGGLAREGVIIRIGDHCQGILRRDGHDFLVERWYKASSEDSATQVNAEGFPRWWKDWRSNTPQGRSHAELPCTWICDDGRRLGDEIDAHGVTWRIVELVE